MVKKIILLSGLPLLFLFVLNSSAMAFGIGVYGNFSYTFGTYENVENSAQNFDKEGLLYGGGLVIDTAVAKKKLFNYRMNLGVGALTENQVNSISAETSGYRIDFYNSFGFGILKFKVFRLWLGPQLGIRYTGFAPDANFDANRFEATLGAVLGLNFNIGSFFTIGLDGGYRFAMGVSIDEIQSINTNTYKGLIHEGFVNVSIIFRIRDKYE